MAKLQWKARLSSADLLVIAILETIGFQSMPGIMKLLREHSSCSRWNLKAIVFSFIQKKSVPFSVLVGNWAQYLPFFSYITCPLHLLCDEEKLALTFYQRTLELKNLLGTAATKSCQYCLWRERQTSTPYYFSFYLNFSNSLKSAAV